MPRFSSRSPLARNDAERAVLRGLVENIGYEVVPFKTAEEKVLGAVPTEVPLTITATGDKGLDPTLTLSETLVRQGYSVAPHIPARMVSGPGELDEIVSRLESAGIDRLVVIGGDAEEPAGEFHQALDLLKALQTRGHHLRDIGIGGYPEGHAFFPDEAIDQALRDKAPYADRVLTQICFSPETLIRWGERIRSEGVELPVFTGMPGPVSRQKLMRISASLGLGQSANFLKKQQNMFWKFFSPSGYRPTRLIRGLVRELGQSRTLITGFHIFTFNELEAVESWRRELRQASRDDQ